MELASIIFSQCLVMFLYMSAGIYLYKTHRISDQTTSQISDLLLRIVSPCIIIQSFSIPFTAEKLMELVNSSLVGAVVLFLSMGISFLLFPGQKVYRFASTFSNAGFIGIPLITATIGMEAVFYITGFLALFNFIQWTFGKELLTGQKQPFEWKTIVQNPMMIGIVIGLIIFLSGLGDDIPVIFTEVFSGFAALNTPLAMVVVGSYIAQIPFLEIFKGKGLIKLALVRLFLIPMITAVVFTFLPFGHQILMTLLIVSATPTGATIAIYSAMYGLDYTQGCKCVAFTTILSIVTIPCVLALASFII